MTMLRERPSETAAPPSPLSVQDLPPLQASPPERRRSWPVDLSEEISLVWGWGLLLAWWALVMVGLAVEPEPAVSELPPSLFYDTVFPLAFLSALVAMTAGLAARRRWGVLGAGAASGLLLVATVGCLTTGHHQFGTWWLVQLGSVLGALGLSGAAWRASGRVPGH